MNQGQGNQGGKRKGETWKSRKTGHKAKTIGKEQKGAESSLGFQSGRVRTEASTQGKPTVPTAQRQERELV